MPAQILRLHNEIWIPHPVREVFPFFADASNLERLTPPSLRFEILTPHPIEMKVGTLIDYKLRLHGIPVRWQSEITEWEPPNRFVDEQRRGPYRIWRHEHIFTEQNGGTLAEDRLEYAVPGGMIVARLFVTGEVANIFAYRKQQLTEIFDIATKRELERKPAAVDSAPRASGPPHSESRLRDIESTLGVEFDDISLLERALVHSSFVAEFPDVFAESNDRLEFLGDAVIDLVIAQELVTRFPNFHEGSLTQTRATLVDKSALAAIGRRLGLGEWLIMGKGERERGGAERDSNCADAFEAVVGAVFADQGYDAAREFILRAMRDELRSLSVLKAPQRHPKSLLHEAAMTRGLSPPVYEQTARKGPDHMPVFCVRVLLNEKTAGEGRGGSKREAEAQAAEDALNKLGNAT